MSVNSCTVDVEDWLGADTCTVGDVGGGVLAEDLAETGDNGDGHLFDDATLPADAGKEICGRITYWPPGLDLFAYEDGSVAASASVDGLYVARYQLYVDYVATGPETAIPFLFGEGAIAITLAWTEGSEVFAAVGTVVSSGVSAVIGWTEGSESIAIIGAVVIPEIPESPEGAMSFTPSAARTITVNATGSPFTAGSTFWSLADPKKPRGWKDPDATVDITFDWGPYLADIADAIRVGGLEFIVDGGLVAVDFTFVGAKCTVFLSAGTLTNGSTVTRAPVTCRITTSSTPPRTEDRTIYLDIEAR